MVDWAACEPRPGLVAADPLMSLSATWATYEVEPVAVSSEGPLSLGVHQIRHPTAREAICILEHGQAATTDKDAWHLVQSALRSWLPLRLYSVLVSRRLSRKNAVRIATTLLSVGLTHEEKSAHETRQSSAPPWGRLVASYRHTYPSGSLDEPWPFWLDQAMRVDQVRSLDILAQFEALAIGNTGSRQGLEALKRRAGFEEVYDEEEALKRQRASLEKLKGLHHQMRKGKIMGSA